MRDLGTRSDPQKSEPPKAARETFLSATGQDLAQNCLCRLELRQGSEKFPGIRGKSDPFKYRVIILYP